jgi:hypothetical protein
MTMKGMGFLQAKKYRQRAVGFEIELKIRRAAPASRLIRDSLVVQADGLRAFASSIAR